MDQLNLDQAQWRTSSLSGDNGQCVQVATNLPDIVAVRDSKNPQGPALVFTHAEWKAFLGGAEAGEFNI